MMDIKKMLGIGQRAPGEADSIEGEVDTLCTPSASAAKIETNSTAIAKSYRELLEKYQADSRETEEKVKSLLFALTLYKWERDRYCKTIINEWETAINYSKWARVYKKTATNFIPQEERPAEVGLYYTASLMKTRRQQNESKGNNTSE